MPQSENDADEQVALFNWGMFDSSSWHDLEKEHRVVILAEAGSGKTEELRQQAMDMQGRGELAFFIRIEDIESDFYNAFEVGDCDQFKHWQDSTHHAWFFLDSIDEARLENPRDFEKAMRRFSKVIARFSHRAHIYLSSRPYAWRPSDDTRLMDELLFFPLAEHGDDIEENKEKEPKSSLKVLVMRPLNREQITLFCQARNVQNIELLLREIERINLWGLAERPFDLEGIIEKWRDDETLGSRLELLRHNIKNQLQDGHNIDRAHRQSFNLERALDGARRLAASVILTGRVGINVPDQVVTKPGIEAQSVLPDWNSREVHALLERGIFNDVIYGAVRFRHRDVKELLAAEWFDGLLKSGNSRSTILSLFFRDQYGEKIITPKLRPILPWLILFDDQVREIGLDRSPSIAVEGGDPSGLPLSNRRDILRNIVLNIVHDNERNAQDNSAIARIAHIDLVEDTKKLLKDFAQNDNAIFFLGRLVWQGEMSDCVAPFLDIAADCTRGVYARRVSIRAVMTCGSIEQIRKLRSSLSHGTETIPEQLLYEIIENASIDKESVEFLLALLEKLPPYDRYDASGLDSALRKYLGRISVSDHVYLKKIIKGLYSYLITQPYIEHEDCDVSEKYVWLLSALSPLIERMIKARVEFCLDATLISILIMIPKVRFWRHNELNENKDHLKKLVPNWSELNDALYWKSIELERAKKALSDQALNDEWQVSWRGKFWHFDKIDLPRLKDFIQTRSLLDDKLVALSSMFRIYLEEGKPEDILLELKAITSGDAALSNHLDLFLNPPVTDEAKQVQLMREKWVKEREAEELEKLEARKKWLDELRENPDRVRSPPELKQGDFSKDQYLLMSQLDDKSSFSSRNAYANWRGLIPEFGLKVATAYRDAAVNHWRYYMPALPSEGHADNSVPFSLIFAMAGLEIEALENEHFPDDFNKPLIVLALRYITWQLNGFPSWLESVYNSFPELVKDAVLKEAIWELENTSNDKPSHHILDDLAYHAPWLHSEVAQTLFDWINTNPAKLGSNRIYCLKVMVNGGMSASDIYSLAKLQLIQGYNFETLAVWHALAVDCAPQDALPDLETWLASLPNKDSKSAAEVFITTLMGGRHINMDGPYFSNFRDANYLKILYVLMHRYIRIQDDIHRESGKSYSPGLRDDAQDARGRLFNLIMEIPGKASYAAVKQLIDDHPHPAYTQRMRQRAHSKAEQDGDLEAWSEEQVVQFNKTQTLFPKTHRQLYELAVFRLIDLKNWLERGNDSPYRTWQGVHDESEMRNLITGWLNQQRGDRYITAQEPELANNQRMDIWLQSGNVSTPVPIEIKLLDKNWSGPKFCERLRNQLAGDYLREVTGGCGVMLLVWKNSVPEKRWEIGDKTVGLDELAEAIKDYWQSISDQFINVEAIEIIVIDLSVRGRVSQF